MIPNRIPIGIAKGITSGIATRMTTAIVMGGRSEQSSTGCKMSDPRCISRIETPINKRIYRKCDPKWDAKCDRKIIAKQSHHNHHHNHHHYQAFADAKAAVVSPFVLERGDEI